MPGSASWRDAEALGATGRPCTALCAPASSPAAFWDCLGLFLSAVAESAGVGPALPSEGSPLSLTVPLCLVSPGWIVSSYRMFLCAPAMRCVGRLKA